MRLGALLAAFLGWGLAGFLSGQASPGLAFLVGLAVGAGAMLAKREE